VTTNTDTNKRDNHEIFANTLILDSYEGCHICQKCLWQKRLKNIFVVNHALTMGYCIALFDRKKINKILAV